MKPTQNERLSTAKSAGRNRYDFESAEIRPRRDSLRQSEQLSAKRITSFGIEMVPSALKPSGFSKSKEVIFILKLRKGINNSGE